MRSAGFVLANGAMSSNTSGEGKLRQKMIDKDLVDCMIALPGQLFYTTQIPVCLWFMTKNKKAVSIKKGKTQERRDRTGETLFIDARQMGTMISRVHKELTEEDLDRITTTYHSWRGQTAEGSYEDIAGYCKSATLEDIQKNDYVLTPGRYVGIAEEEDDGIPFEEKMRGLSAQLFEQMEKSSQLDTEIRSNLKVLGYE